jgi:RimK family alpha-L-glutamate ligase
MDTSKKIIFLNAGTETRRACVRGIGDTPYAWYHTKRMALHIARNNSLHFLYKNTPINWDGGTVFTRLRGTDNQFCGILYDYFAHQHISANDPINRSYENSAEKISQMSLLALHGIRIPESFIFREESYAKNRTYLEEHFTFPLVFKTDGSRGRNVYRVETLDALHTHIQNKQPHILALVQPFIENTYDTRTLVAFGTILGSIKRTRTSGYLNNIAQGAIPEVYSLTEEEKNIALRAAEVCGMDIAGVDMIHTDAGPIVLEVNKSPQIHGFESVHDFKVFERVGEIMKKRLQ